MVSLFWGGSVFVVSPPLGLSLLLPWTVACVFFGGGGGRRFDGFGRLLFLGGGVGGGGRGAAFAWRGLRPLGFGVGTTLLACLLFFLVCVCVIFFGVG